ncbi:MAG: DUF378 domain-containing protein [Oscillospiraceae bacterium]|nr:DUF378 domain-containing protein [Oscillospiraceae bacterium]
MTYFLIKELYVLDRVSLVLVILGALNWACIGLFSFNLVDYTFGAGTALSRIIYTVIGIAGIWCVSLLFRDRRSHIEDL